MYAIPKCALVCFIFHSYIPTAKEERFSHKQYAVCIISGSTIYGAGLEMELCVKLCILAVQSLYNWSHLDGTKKKKGGNVRNSLSVQKCTLY